MLEHQLHNSYDTYNAFIYTDTTYHSHFHKNYELIYIVSGAMTVQVNNSAVQLFEGEMILISPFSVHSFVADTKTRIWVGVFAEDYVTSFAKKNNRLQYSKFRCEKPIEDFLNQYLFYQGTPDLHMGKACLYMVCGECLKHATVETANPELDFKQQVIEYICSNLSDEITLQKVSLALGYEYHYFSRILNRGYHINFSTLCKNYFLKFYCHFT